VPALYICTPWIGLAYIGRLDSAIIFTIGVLYIVSDGTVLFERLISKFVIFGMYVLLKSPILYNWGFVQLTEINCFVLFEDANVGAGGLPTILLNNQSSVFLKAVVIKSGPPMLQFVEDIPMPPTNCDLNTALPIIETVERPYDTIEDSDETPGFIDPAPTVERPYDIIDDNDETPGFIDPALITVDRPYDIMDDNDETPGFIDPAPTVERPYDIIEDNDETPGFIDPPLITVESPYDIIDDKDEIP